MSASSRSLTVALLLVAGAVASAAAASTWKRGVDPFMVVADLAVGWAFMAGGTLVLSRRGQGTTTHLLALTGLSWLAGTVWPSLEFLHRAVLLQLMASYPAGRLPWPASGARDRLRLAVVGAGYAANLTRLGGAPIAAAAWAMAMLWFTWGGTMRHASTARLARPAAVAALTALGLAVLAGALARLAGVAPGPTGLLVNEATLAIAGIALAADLLLGRWPQAALTQAIIDLGEAGVAGSIRQRLAALLGDPSLTLAFAVDGTGTYVDEDGRPIAVTPDTDQTVAPMLLSGEPVGLMAYDPSALDDPQLVDAVTAAAVLAMANARLQAEVRSRVAEVHASRERLVHTADAERRRLERRLQLGPVRRLDRAGELLSAADRADGDAAERLVGELDSARAQLVDFAHGVHPASLTQDGLAAALVELARRAPVRVTVEADFARTEPLTEATLYFVCSEAVANAAKHAHASRVAVRLHQTDAVTSLTVTDDGAGGARTARGGGLAGLADRLEALGGRLRVKSHSGAGTTITAELPRGATATGPDQAGAGAAATSGGAG